MPFFFYDSTMLIVLPAAIFAMIAQYMVSSTFNRYSNVPSRKGMTGADVAKALLSLAGIHDIRVERVPGKLSDHYDPKNGVLRLSDAVYGSTSIAAIGVAAHETGHAIQHSMGYAPLGIRSAIVPLVGFGNGLAVPLVFLGIFLGMWSGTLGQLMINIGLILFTLVVAFQLITLPVEFNASKRAIEVLDENNILSGEELVGAKKVLNAAALTYVAAAAVAISTLLRLILISQRGRDRRG